MPRPRLRSEQKARVKREAQDCCEYCGAQEVYSPDTFSIEHIQPIAKGGTNDFDNLANACQGCNNRKYTRTEAIDPLTVISSRFIIRGKIRGQSILPGMRTLLG